MQEKYQQLKQKIDEAQTIGIFGHNHIDGDCAASCLGLGKILEKLGKQVKYFTAQELEKNLLFLKGINKFRTELKGDKFDIIIFMDTGDADKLNDIYKDNKEFFEKNYLISIDHHISNTGYGDLNILNSDCASNAEHVFLVIEMFWQELIDSDIATTLLTGLITDTGNFMHPNTNALTFENASKLLSLGADRELIVQKIFKSNELGALEITRLTLSRIQYNKKTIYSYITQEEINDAGVEKSVKELVYGIFRTVRGFENYVMLIDMGDYIKGSISNTKGLSSDIAAIFGGGGHTGRAGFKVPKNPDEDTQDKIQEIIKTISEYK